MTSHVRQHSRRLAWTSAVIHGLVHASVLLLPPLLGDLQRAFQVSLLQLLAVANAMYLVYGLAAIPAGFLADRFGSRRMLVVAAAGCGLSLLLIAAAPSFLLLSVGLVALGVCAGVYHPSGLSLLSRGVASGRTRARHRHPRRGRQPGRGHRPGLGRLLRHRLRLAGGLRRGRRAVVRLRPAGHHPAARAGAEPDHHRHPAPIGTRRSPSPTRPAGGRRWRGPGRHPGGFARNRPLRWLLLSLVAAGFTYRGFLTFLPLHLSHDAGGRRLGSYVMSAVLLAGMVAQRYGGELADRRARERLYLLLSAAGLPVLLAPGPHLGRAAIGAALGFGFVWALAQPVANALTATYARATDHGLLYGIQFAATFGVGSFATTVGGFLLAEGGTRLVFLGLAGATILAIAAIFALLRTVNRPESRGQT